MDSGSVRTNADRKPTKMVSLITRDGAFLVHFETDRDEFSPIATHERDRVFILASTTGDSVVYVELEPWRISGKTIDTPKPRKRWRKTATIIRFPGSPKIGGAE